jgi:hypothetical protein
MPASILTSVRETVWRAVDASPALTGRLARTYRFDDRPGRLAGRPSPTIGDLPALAIYPDGATSEWRTNQFQEVRCRLRIDVWTREWDVAAGEAIWRDVVAALYGSLPEISGGVHRVASISAAPPRIVPLADGANGPLATQWSFQVEISGGYWNPADA